jgi:hypothetical protein
MASAKASLRTKAAAEAQGAVARATASAMAVVTWEAAAFAKPVELEQPLTAEFAVLILVRESPQVLATALAHT